ncbi:MAG TPA: STT3 domain-containing protein, partial [bacterium]|nr:STT3 domain-containing protein [bacterium]
MKKNKTVLITIFFLFCVFIIAFFIRVLPAIQYSFLSGDKVLFHDTDPYYHMRRITYFLNHNFQLPEFDYYLNYPEGGVSFWPSGFAKLAAYFSYVFNKGNITKYGVEYAACWLPPILGALTVIPVWFFGRILFGNAAGLLAALFFAFQPYHISYSMLGKIDHHVAETFSAFIIYISFALILKKLIFISDNLNLKDLFIKLTPYSLFAAITIWFAYMMWTGATLYLIPCFLTSFLLVFLLSKEKLIPFAFVMAECGLFALALIFYPSITSYWGRLGLFNHDAFSLLHIFIFSVFTLFYSGIFILTSKIIRISKIRMFYAKCFYCLIFGAFLFLIVKIFLPQSYSGIMEGVKLLMKQGEAPYHIWLTTISEYSPLLSVENGFEIIRLQYALTGFIYLVPFGLLAILICIYKNSVEKSPDLILFFIISVLMGLMAVKQSRYCYIFGVNVSILGAYSLVLISELLSQSNIRVSIKNK